MSAKYFLRSSWPAISLSGMDRLEYLHRLTSQHFKSAKVDDLIPAAFLSAKGGAQALFVAFIEADQVILLTEPAMLTPLFEMIEKFHFGEDLKYSLVKDLSAVEYFVPVAQEGPESNQFRFLAEMPWASGPTHKTYLGLPKADAKLVGQEIGDIERWKILKNSGYPQYGIDITADNILVESPKLEHFVHRNKGCYPGQEVLERIATYGNVAKQLVKVQTDRPVLGLPTPILYEGRVVGQMTSSFDIEGESFGLATVKRLEIDTSRSFNSDCGAFDRLQIVDTFS